MIYSDNSKEQFIRSFMKYLILMTVLLGNSLIAYGIEDSDFDKVQWSYEVFDDSGDPGEFNHSVSKGSLASRPKNEETLDVPLKNADCSAHVPSIHVNSLLVNRGMSCKEKGNKTFVHTATLECGKSKVKDVSTSYAHGTFCETSKKCYQKSYKIVFACSYR